LPGSCLLWGSSGVSSGSVVEVVEWSRVEEGVVLRSWREKNTNEEMSHHAFYGVKCLQDYIAIFNIARDDVADSALQRNMGDKGEIDNLAMEQYLALIRTNQAPGVVKLEIRGNVNFEIKIQFMRELKEDTFFENKNVDAHEHVERVLDIVGLFNIPSVSHDGVMLRVFLITLIGDTKRWVDRLPQEPSIPRISLKMPLSKGTVHRQELPNSLRKSATSSKKETRHYTKPGNDIMTFCINSPLITSITIRRSAKVSKGFEPSNLQGRMNSLGSSISADNMSREVLTFGSTMRIPLLYREEHSQWVERFMNYLKEQTNGEAMINSIKNDKSMWSDQEKRIQKIDRLARSLLVQGLLNDIYSLIDNNKTAKDLWDALARHMLGSEYEWKQYATMMRHNKNLMDINIDTLYNILKENQGDVNDAIGSKKKTVVVTFDPLALIAEKTKVSKSKEKVVVSSNSKGSDADDFSELKKITALLAKVKCYNCKKEGHFAKDCKKVKVKDYEYYKTKMLLAKKDKDEQVLLAEDQAWMESSSDLDQEINANMVFMAQIEKVLSNSEASSSSADEKISEVSY
nr:hypothetical protein [Tanacetum cinerariifolium]